MDTPPTLTREQSRTVDRIAMNELGYPGVVLMENAGINTAAAVLDYLDDVIQIDPEQARIGVLCGGGNNGGDGYVIARHLSLWGAAVTVFATTGPASLTGDAAVNHRIAAALDLPILTLPDESAIDAAHGDLAACDLLIDALLGTGFRGEVRQPTARLIEVINELEHPHTVAVDLPSGLDCDTGQPTNATVRAHLTVSFVARKAGFDAAGAADWTGRVIVGDIGTPAGLVDRARNSAPA